MLACSAFTDFCQNGINSYNDRESLLCSGTVFLQLDDEGRVLDWLSVQFKHQKAKAVSVSERTR